MVSTIKWNPPPTNSNPSRRDSFALFSPYPAYNPATMTDQPYPFGSEEDLRNVIRLLVNAHKKWQVRAVRLNELLNTVMALPPKTRANLTVANITATGEQITPRIEAEVNGVFARLCLTAVLARGLTAAICPVTVFILHQV